MASASRYRPYQILRDRIGIALAFGGLGLVTVVSLVLFGAGAHALIAIGIAGVFGVALASALVQRNTRHWHRMLARIEAETRRRLASTEQSSSFSARVFMERLAQECRRSNRYGLELTVLRVRCDAVAVAHLGASDEAAVAIVTSTAACLRSEDVVGRLSDLEYAYFLPHTGRQGAEVVLERIDGLGALVDCIGLAVFREDGIDADELLRQAGIDGERRLRHAETMRGWNQRMLVN
jgi:GGDEF domain-containing protein